MSDNPSLQKEPTFEYDDFGSNVIDTGLHALARRIQHSLLTEPNTLPNMADFGVGVNTYIHELLDGETLDDLKVKINTQIEKFHPQAPIKTVEVMVIPAEKLLSNENGLLVGFELTEILDGESLFMLGFYNKKGTNIRSEITFG